LHSIGWQQNIQKVLHKNFECKVADDENATIRHLEKEKPDWRLLISHIAETKALAKFEKFPISNYMNMLSRESSQSSLEWDDSSQFKVSFNTNNQLLSCAKTGEEFTSKTFEICNF
jgi:hypothetical protein